MKTKLLLIVAIGAIMFQAKLLQAQQSGQFEFGLASGAAVPSKDFGDIAKAGPRLDVSLGFYMIPRLVIGLEVGYKYFGAPSGVLNQLRYENGDPSLNYYWEANHVSGYAKFLLSRGDATPYFKIGAGSYSYSVTAENVFGSNSHKRSDVGLLYGSGFQFRMGSAIGGFIEATYFGLQSNENMSIEAFQFGAGLTFLIGGH